MFLIMKFFHDEGTVSLTGFWMDTKREQDMYYILNAIILMESVELYEYKISLL